MMHRSAALGLLALAMSASACGNLVVIEPIGSVTLAVPAQTSVILAADGSLLAELHAEQDRDLVSLDDIPRTLRDAVVAVEDARFYHHAGVDARAVARAVVENAREGRITQGGSTITQQLAKNAVVGDAQTLERKLEEASVALQLEAQLTKDEILEAYLNTVYFGNGAYGAQTAAREYFGIDVGEVSLPQSALLAALLAAPSTYDPRRDPEAATARRNLVLRRMGEQGMLTGTAVAAAQAAPLGVVAPADALGWRFPYFTEHVVRLLQHDPTFAALGTDPAARGDRLFRGGLRIETTVDPVWQAAAEQAVAETLTDPGDPRAAVVAIEPATGSIRALVGGRDYDDQEDPQARFNLATDGARQPGSVFKPIVLATALGQGHSLDEMFAAPPALEIPARPGHPEPWVVHNYGDQGFGELSLRAATALSVNVVYAQLMEQVGPEAVAATAAALGVRRDLLPFRSLALGAQEVSPLEMASVQATLAAGGVYRQPTAVTRIMAADGTVLYERGDTPGERVLDEAVAWLVTDTLGEVVGIGTGVRANLQRPMAGKTGTTNTGADAWFAGYTPDLAAAVWIGFPEARVPMVPPTTRIRVEGGNWPAELFARFGLRALADIPADEFDIPAVALTTVRVDTSRNCLPNPYTPPELIAERGYLTGTEPTDICREPTGPPVTDVPDVTGLPAAAAVGVLEGAGFLVSQRPESSVVLPPGFVVRQDPLAGAAQTLAGGFVATIYISSADRTEVAVPDVLGLDLVAATAVLDGAGFVIEVVRACPDGTADCAGASLRPGQVWEQAPAGGTLPRHAVIRLSAYPG